MGVYNIQKEINKWNIDYSYTVGTQVVFNGKLFIAKQNVPKGINLGMSEYWERLATDEEIEEVTNDVEELSEEVADIQSDLVKSTVEVSGNPLNFTTGIKQVAQSVEIDIEPIQDLHGYNYPWVGGAGKNKLITDVATIKAWNVNGTWSGNTYTPTGKSITFTIMTDSDDNVIGIKVNGTNDNAVTDFDIYRDNENSCPFNGYILNGCSNGSVSTYDLRVSDITSGANATYGSDTTIALSNTGKWRCCIFVRANAVLSNVMFYPMIRIATETDSLFAPYENICAITGRTQDNILGCGKNLCSGAENGRIDGNTGEKATSISGYPRCRVKDFAYLQAGKKYRITAYTTQSKSLMLEYDYWETNTFGNNTRLYSSEWMSVSSLGFLLEPTEDKNLTMMFMYSDNSNIDASELQIQLEEGATATPYEPYTHSNDITVSFGQTVYGAKLDVGRGLLVVDRLLKEFDGSEDEDWNIVSGTSKFYIESFPNLDLSKPIITNKYPFSGVATSGSASVLIDKSCYIQNVTRVWVYDSDYADVSELKAELAINKLQICYFLTTPITIEVTPHQIALLEGVNNIGVDGTTLTLSYRNGTYLTRDELNQYDIEAGSAINYLNMLITTQTDDLPLRFKFHYDSTSQKYGFIDNDNNFIPFG